jgi:amidase
MLSSDKARFSTSPKPATYAILCVFTFVLFSTAALADDRNTDQPERHELLFMPAHRIAELIRERAVTSSEVVDAYLEQIRLHNPKLNAIVTLDEPGARERARQADEALAQGIVWGPLHGVPVTIKDNYATRGLKTTSSLPGLSDYVPSYDATVVKRIREAGAVILGKTNLPALGMDTQTNSPLFGLTSNPWDLKRTTGGSSGGDAAAVAAGLTALGMGNDIGGSIRIPAHFCGIYGMKPTENFTSTYGISPGGTNGDIRTIRHMACGGPLARCVEDLKLGLSVIAGPDLRNPDVPRVDLGQKPVRRLKDLHLTWTDDFGGVPVTKETSEAIRSFASRLAEQGCRVERLSSSPFEPHIASTAPEARDLYGVNRADRPHSITRRPGPPTAGSWTWSSGSINPHFSGSSATFSVPGTAPMSP